MKEYRAGHIYQFVVTDIREVNERKYIYLSDGKKDTYRVPPYDYQFEWESFNLPKILNCYVVSVNEFGLPLLAQVRKEVLAHNYTEEGTEYAFKLVAKRQDANTGVQYYELHDPFGLSHRYYPNSDEPVRDVSDIFSLIFIGIEEKENNKAFLKLAPIRESIQVKHPIEKDLSEGASVGIEGELLEFKSTLVFPAGSTGPDIDRQVVIICKTIAGFMNKSGGQLLIGVNDSGIVTGIEQDFPYLNTSAIDAHSYQPNYDGFENKIRTAVKSLLGNTANANIQVTFPTHEGTAYCKIEISQVLKPIFMNQSKLYQQAGNMTQLLKGDEIAWFIEERYRKRLSIEGGAKPESKTETIEEVEEVESISAPEYKPLLPAVPKVQKSDKIWYWMTFYKDGGWSFDSKPISAEDKVYEVPIPNSLKNERLIMAYKNGCVNVVIPYDQIKPKGKTGRKLRKIGNRYSNGWNKEAEILRFFCTDRRDLLVFKSMDETGSEYVKIHNVEAISVHGSLHLAGNILINPKLNASITGVHMLPIHDFHFVSSLVLKNHQTSGYLGFRRKDKTLDKVFYVLEELLAKG